MHNMKADRFLLHIGPPITLLICWEALSQGGIIHSQFFPPPSEIVLVGIRLITHGDFLLHVRASLSRILMAFFLGGTLGVVTGLLMGWSRNARTVLNPHISLLYPIPKIALLPAMFALFGVSETTRVLTMSIAVFLLVTINTMGGVQQINQSYIDIAIDNGAGTLALFREVIIPGALDDIFTGLKLGFGVGFVVIVVIEMIAAPAGLGYLIWNSWRLFALQEMYVAILTIGLLGMIFIYGTEQVGMRITPWNPPQP